MLKLPILCTLTCLYTVLGADIFMGKGLWTILGISQCPEQGLGLTAFWIDYNKHKINRTHEAITAHVSIRREITKSYGLYISVCKYVDGGCKLHNVIAGNLGQLSDKYAKETVVDVMAKAKCKNEYFPIPEGEYDVDDYLIDICKIPPVCVYGKFEITFYLLLNLRRVACLKFELECKKCEGEECCGN